MGESKLPLSVAKECHLPIANISLNSYLALFVAIHRNVIQMFTRHNRAMCRFLYVVWWDLSVIFRMGRPHTYSSSRECGHGVGFKRWLYPLGAREPSYGRYRDCLVLRDR